jgi:D-xylose transport system substrate-binding protein
MQEPLLLISRNLGYTQTLKLIAMFRKTTIIMLFICSLTALYAQDSLKIGFSLGDFSADRWSQEPQYFNAAARELGAKVLFEYAYGNAAKQLDQAAKLINSGIKVLVIFPTNSDGWEGVVETAHKAGVKVVAYDRILKNADVDYYVSFFNDEIGRQQAKYAVERRPKGNYILLEGPTSDINSIFVLNGQKEVLKPYTDRGDIKILLEKHLDTWNSIDAYNEIQSFLDKNKVSVDAILAANDDLAGGSIMALDMNMGTYDILITGQDASLGGCQNILDGKQSMTTYGSIRNLAAEAAAVCVKLARGEKITSVNSSISNGNKEIPAILLNTVAVDKNNMKQTVIKDGYLKADQLHFAQ